MNERTSMARRVYNPVTKHWYPVRPVRTKYMEPGSIRGLWWKSKLDGGVGSEA